LWLFYKRGEQAMLLKAHKEVLPVPVRKSTSPPRIFSRFDFHAGTHERDHEHCD
jgi:hypothetical protein